VQLKHSSQDYSPPTAPGFICSGARSPISGGIVNVSLCSGEVLNMSNVTAVHLTGANMTFLRGKEVLNSIPRKTIHLSACEPSQPPPNA